MYGKSIIIDNKGNVLDKDQTTKYWGIIRRSKIIDQKKFLKLSIRFAWVLLKDIDLGTHIIKKVNSSGIETHLIYKAIEDSQLNFKGTDKHQTINTAYVLVKPIND